MKPLELKAARTRLGYKQKYVADQLGVSVPTYRKKEDGNSAFSIKEIPKMADILQLDMEQVNDIFFDGLLPYGIR